MDEVKRIKDSVDLCNQRDVLKQEVSEYLELVNKKLLTVDEYKKANFDYEAPKIFFLILSVVGGLFLAFCIGMMFDNNALASVLGIILPFVVYNLVLKNVFHAIKKQEYDAYQQLLIEAENEKPALVELLNQTQGKLNELESDMRNEDNCIIPENYWDNANLIYSLILNKRAYDLVSAINKFEDIMHQMRMESMAQESLEWQQISAYNTQIAAENAQIAAANSQKAATYSGVSAFFSILNYDKLNS